MNRALCGLTVERVPRVIHIHRGNSLVQHIPVMIVATSSRLLFTNLTNLTKLESNDPSRNWVVNPPDSTTGQSPELPVLNRDDVFEAHFAGEVTEVLVGSADSVLVCTDAQLTALTGIADSGCTELLMHNSINHLLTNSKQSNICFKTAEAKFFKADLSLRSPGTHSHERGGTAFMR